MDENDPLLAPMEGAVHQTFAGMGIDFVKAGNARVKRLVYPPGAKWSEHVKPHVGTDQCMHAHVGFLAKGNFAGVYPDGCTFDHVAPAVIAIDPGHDSWVVGDEPVVLIEFDFERNTIEAMGLPSEHRH